MYQIGDKVRINLEGLKEITGIVIEKSRSSYLVEPLFPEDRLSPLEIPLPSLIDGKLFMSMQRIGQYEDLSVLFYQTKMNEKRVLVNSLDGTFDYPVPDIQGIVGPCATALKSKTDLYIAYCIAGSGITINRYAIGNGLSLVSQSTVGDSRSRLHDFIRLDSGRLMLCWHEFDREAVKEGIEIGFAYESGEWHTLKQFVPDLPRPFGNPSINGMSMAQNADDSIWCFFQRDGHKKLYGIKLIETGGSVQVSELFNPLIDRKDPLQVDGENPKIYTSPVEDGILVAYPRNRDRLQYPESSTWSFIQVIKVLPDASYSAVWNSAYRTERTSRFAFGGDWLAYGKWNEDVTGDATFNELVLETQDNVNTLDTLDGGTTMPRHPGHTYAVGIQGSLYWIVAQMNDGFIHFFKI